MALHTDFHSNSGPLPLWTLVLLLTFSPCSPAQAQWALGAFGPFVSVTAAVPYLLAPKTGFMEDSFPQTRGLGMFQDNSNTLHYLCTLFLLLHQLSDRRHWILEVGDPCVMALATKWLSERAKHREIINTKSGVLLIYHCTFPGQQYDCPLLFLWRVWLWADFDSQMKANNYAFLCHLVEYPAVAFSVFQSIFFPFKVTF